MSLFFVTCFVVSVVCVKRGHYKKEDVQLNDDDSLLWIRLMFLSMEAFGFVGFFDHKSSEPKRFVIHNTLYFFVSLLIWYFGIDNSFDCNHNLCADKKIRSFNYNTFVFALFLIIMFTVLLQIVLYLSMPKFEQLSQEWEDNYQSKKQIKKSNASTKNKSSVDTMVDIQTSQK